MAKLITTKEVLYDNRSNLSAKIMMEMLVGGKSGDCYQISVKDYVVNEIDNGDYPCIVVTRFTAEAKYLYQELSTAFKDKSVGIFIGPMKKPNDPIGDFKSGKVDILIANERMISKGHNLQLSHTIYFFSSNYSLEDRDQTEDRISRYGQTEKCLITDFIADGTIDMKVYASIKMKRNLLDYFRNTEIEDDLCDTTDDMKEVFNV